jgi:hypothetical protein
MADCPTDSIFPRNRHLGHTKSHQTAAVYPPFLLLRPGNVTGLVLVTEPGQQKPPEGKSRPQDRRLFSHLSEDRTNLDNFSPRKCHPERSPSPMIFPSLLAADIDYTGRIMTVVTVVVSWRRRIRATTPEKWDSLSANSDCEKKGF